MAFVSTNAYTTQGEVGMEFSGFDWDRGNLEKCQKHGISAKLIESVFDRPVAILAEEAEAVVATADLTDYDLSGAKLVRFELKRKDKSINLRLPEHLLDAVRSRAEKERIPYQRFIRMALEQALQRGKS